ncbi:MAG: hypothetical protein ACTHQQ_16375 [Solirubrobacteraceae bacterium]
MSIGSHKRQKDQKRRRHVDGDLIVAGCVGLSDRLEARLRARQLDQALASGEPAESTPALALRARRLTALADRRAKAATYRRVLREASEEASRSYMRITPRRGRVVAASAALSRLAEALAQPGPVAARGAAEASLLLTDGTGPLYNSANQASLEGYALRALADLTLA